MTANTASANTDCIFISLPWWCPILLHQYRVFRISLSAQHSSQSPVSLPSDASSPRPYVSPRNSTPQSNQKSLLTVHPSSITSSQTRVSSNTETNNRRLRRVQGALLPPSLSSPVCYGCEILSFWLSTAYWLYFYSSYFLPCCLFVSSGQYVFR